MFWLSNAGVLVCHDRVLKCTRWWTSGSRCNNGVRCTVSNKNLDQRKSHFAQVHVQFDWKMRVGQSKGAWWGWSNQRGRGEGATPSILGRALLCVNFPQVIHYQYIYIYGWCRHCNIRRGVWGTLHVHVHVRTWPSVHLHARLMYMYKERCLGYATCTCTCTYMYIHVYVI